MNALMCCPAKGVVEQLDAIDAKIWKSIDITIAINRAILLQFIPWSHRRIHRFSCWCAIDRLADDDNKIIQAYIDGDYCTSCVDMLWTNKDVIMEIQRKNLPNSAKYLLEGSVLQWLIQAIKKEPVTEECEKFIKMHNSSYIYGLLVAAMLGTRKIYLAGSLHTSMADFDGINRNPEDRQNPSRWVFETGIEQYICKQLGMTLERLPPPNLEDAKFYPAINPNP